ncbi:MAG: putative porin, partial [Verrucomicrobia bacterium]|nr:putative porin [Verrucomicrobiota bacterium]
MKFNGDLRMRYDGIFGQNPAFVDRNRLRYRLRFGFTADMADDLEIGFKLTSSEGSGGGDPISGNQTFTGNGSKKLVYIDQVYAKWSPIHTPDWAGAFTLGKMENPFVFPSTMMFDKDYTPEGFAGQFAYNINSQHALKFNAGVFALYEDKASSSDSWLGGAQLRWDAKWNSKWSSTVGVAAFALKSNEELTTANVTDSNKGNSRATINGVANVLKYQFNPIYVDAGITRVLESFPMYPGAFPITVSGDYVKNCSALTDNQGYSIGLQLGKAGKKGTWQV